MTMTATIDGNGIHAPTYAEILSELTTAFQSIYGSDAYLGPDSQDGQMLAIFAQAISDTNAMAVAAYNAFSPATAQGAGLSSVVKINGIARHVPSNSTADLTIVGVAGTLISNGVATDTNGNRWNLPASVTVPVSGTVVVTATASESGNIAAGPGTITTIATPTLGWQTVNNVGAATPGAAVESDAELRVRQSNSTQIPSLTVLGGILGAVQSIDGVTQAKAYENSTGTTDANTLPPHSISLVVEGGDALEIATSIYDKKTPGTATYGTTSETVVDSITLVESTINFFRPTVQDVSAVVLLQALTGYVATTGVLIQQAVADYIDLQAIGDDVYQSKVVGAADAAGFSSTFNIQRVYQARADMVATGGPIGAGGTHVNVSNTANYFNGAMIAIELDNSTLHYTTVSSIAGIQVNFPDAVPGGRSIPDGNPVYVVGDLTYAFNELSTSDSANISLVVS